MNGVTKYVKEEELLRLLLAGYMLKECAAALGLSYATIRRYVNTPEFMLKLKGLSQTIWERIDQEISAIKEDISSRLQEASEDALSEMKKLLAESSPLVRFKAAQDIMDRDNRVSRTKRLEETHDHNFINPLILVHAAKVAREIEGSTVEGGGDSSSVGPTSSTPKLPPGSEDGK